MDNGRGLSYIPQAKLIVDFCERERGFLEASFNFPLHGRIHEELLLKRSDCSVASALLDDRDTPLLKRLVEVLLDRTTGVTHLGAFRFKLRVAYGAIYDATVDTIESIKEAVVEACTGCALFSEVVVNG